MVGGYALRYALGHPAIGLVTAIGRRMLGISHPKLKEVLHPDFADCSALADALSSQNAAVFCLGAYTGAVSDAELRKITVDYTIEFARALHAARALEIRHFQVEACDDQKCPTSHVSVFKKTAPSFGRLNADAVVPCSIHFACKQWSWPWSMVDHRCSRQQTPIRLRGGGGSHA